MIDFNSIRNKSRFLVKNLGYDFNPNLPLLEEGHGKNIAATIRRVCTLNALVACAYGCPTKNAIAWLNENNLLSFLGVNEKHLLKNSTGVMDFTDYKHKVESLWAFLWALKLVDILDFTSQCGNNMIAMLPNLNTMQSVADFSQNLELREMEEIVEACDLAYCLHWSIVDYSTVAKVKKKDHVLPHVIIERRRALEWLISDCEWDDISLDT